MRVLTAPLSPVGLAAIVYVSFLFARLSRRLNAVAKKADHTNWFWVASGFLIVATVSQAVQTTAILAPERALPILLEPWFPLVTFHLPLAIGATIDIVLVWYYWGWIVKEGALGGPVDS